MYVRFGGRGLYSSDVADYIRAEFPFFQLISDETSKDLKFPDEPPEEPRGYRMKNFTGLVPQTLKGAIVVDLQQAQQLHDKGQVTFIDVMPLLFPPADYPKDKRWDGNDRRNIPGSHWLANVGYGHLTLEMKAYFKNHLARITKGDTSHPVLFYCMENCWQSWNAAKRALSIGYTSVYWFPLGTDGWVRGGGKVEPSMHPPLPKNFFD